MIQSFHAFKILIVLTLVVLSPPAIKAFASTPTVVNVAVWAQFVEPDSSQPNLLELLEHFHRDDIDVNIMVVPGESTEYAEKVLVMLATLGDDAPDLFIMEPRDAHSVYATDAALPLDSYLQRDFLFSDELLFFDDYNGHIVGIPGSVSVEPLAYNAAALDAAGLDDPNNMFGAGQWDLETFAQYSTRVTRREGNGDLIQIGFLGSVQSPYNDWPFIHNFGGRVMTSDGNTTLINSPQVIEAYDWMTDQVVRDAIVLAEFEAPGTLEKGPAGDVVFGQGSPSAYHLGLFPYLPDFAPYPSGPAGRYTMADFDPWIINAGSNRADAAWEVLKFILEHQARHQMHYLGAIPNFRDLIREHIVLQMDYGQERTPVEIVWNEALNTFASKPRYRKPDVQRILSAMTLDILGGQADTGEAVAEAARQINAILAED